MTVAIVEQDGRLAVSTPYHPDFPARARLLGGRWDGIRRAWMFDAGERERVQSLCQEIYGTWGPESNALSAEFVPAATGHNSGDHNQFAENTAVRPHYYGHRERLRRKRLPRAVLRWAF